METITKKYRKPKGPRISLHARSWIGRELEITWGESRGRDTYGYTTCTLRSAGRKLAACNGGGYDMRGTVIGNWIAAEFGNELHALPTKAFPERTHWQPEHKRVCVGVCKEKLTAEYHRMLADETINCGEVGKAVAKIEQVKLPEDCYTCPTCGGETRQSRDGATVADGRSLHGLRFYDPTFDPGKAKVKHAPVFGTDADAGKTVAELEKEGKSLGLERYQAFHSASSKLPTKKHTIAQIDGACGLRSVEDILHALGLSLEQVVDKKKLDVYIIREYVAS